MKTNKQNTPQMLLVFPLIANNNKNIKIKSEAQWFSRGREEGGGGGGGKNKKTRNFFFLTRRSS